jgi:aspartate racemase
MMHTIGLIGGMSWESTVPYYRHINEAVRQRLGGLHSARIVLYSVDFHDIEQLQRSGEWDRAGAVLAAAAQALERAGADFLILCTNTMHKIAPAIESAVRIPLLHIADTTASAIVAAGHRCVGLLATRYTMEQDFYRERLQQMHGIQVLIPGEPERSEVHRIIYEELCLGTIKESSRAHYRHVMSQLANRGATAILLGCTEISLLVESSDSPLPLFDTTELHALAAVDRALR